MIEEKILKEYLDKGLSYVEISHLLNSSVTTLRRYAKKYNLKSKIGSQGARKHRYNHDFFKKIESEEKAYWLGFIAADGCVYCDKVNNNYRLQINLKGSDIEHLNKFQKAIGSDYKIMEKLVGKSKSPVCQLKINSTKMCMDLINLNIIERKSIVFEPPKIPENLISHFIRGYWDGDGWIKEGKGTNKFNVGFVAGINMMDYLKEVMPIKLSLYKLKYNDNVLSYESGMHEKICNMYNYLYKDATVFLDRKKEKFDNIMSRLVVMQGQ